MLTAKQEKFCLIYVETGNATYAYKQAYDTSSMTDKTVNEKASLNLKKGKIRARINELRDDVAKEHKITVDDLLNELNEHRSIALQLENPQLNAANNATMGKAKLLGFLDRDNQDGKDSALLLAQAMAQFASKINGN